MHLQGGPLAHSRSLDPWSDIDFTPFLMAVNMKKMVPVAYFTPKEVKLWAPAKKTLFFRPTFVLIQNCSSTGQIAPPKYLARKTRLEPQGHSRLGSDSSAWEFLTIA